MAGPALQSVALMGLQRVMEPTQPGQGVELGDARRAPGLDVVDLEPHPHVAGGHHALGVASTPSLTTAVRKASSIIERTTRTGTGPPPATSQRSPGCARPRTSAAWSITT